MLESRSQSLELSHLRVPTYIEDSMPTLKKINAGLIVTLIIASLVSLMGIEIIKRTITNRNKTVLVVSEKLIEIESLQAKIVETLSRSHTYLIMGGADNLAKYLKSEEEAIKQLVVVEKIFNIEEEKILTSRIKDIFQNHQDVIRKLTELKIAGKTPSELKDIIRTRLNPEGMPLENTIGELVKKERLTLKKTKEESNRSAQKLTTLYKGLALFSFLACFIISYLLRKSIKAAVAGKIELRKTVASRDEVLAIVSHDLKNPLNAILLSLNLMEKKRHHEQHFMLDHIAKIKRSTHRMIAIIEDLLNISQMEVGTYHLKMNQICGIELLDEAIDALIPSAEKKEIKIMTNFELKEFKVKCDKEKILRVFSNLLGNALKFTPQGGQVILGTKRIDPNWVEFSISDSGPGIALENHKKVFQRFWREKKSEHEGTGLGLAIAKGIVEAHGGMIGLSEKVQKGCHFYFLLPLIKTHGDFKHQNFSRSN